MARVTRQTEGKTCDAEKHNICMKISNPRENSKRRNEAGPNAIDMPIRTRAANNSTAKPSDPAS